MYRFRDRPKHAIWLEQIRIKQYIVEGGENVKQDYTEKEALEFIQLMKTLTEEEQQGLYLIIKGAAAVAGERAVFE